MIDVNEVMNDTAKVRKNMWALWESMQKGNMKGREVKSEIATANVILSAHKVDIAAAHFAGSTAQVVVSTPKRKQISNGHSRRIAS